MFFKGLRLEELDNKVARRIVFLRSREEEPKSRGVIAKEVGAEKG